MTGNELIWFLLTGAVAGWLAGTLTKGSGYGLIGDLVVGILGAVLGAWIFSLFGVTTWGIWGTIFVALVGALVLIGLVQMFSARGRRSY